MNRAEYTSYAKAMYDAPLDSTENPPGQKFPIGTRVKLVRYRYPFSSGSLATVEYTYSQKYARFGFDATNFHSYALRFDKGGSCSWFDEKELAHADADVPLEPDPVGPFVGDVDLEKRRVYVGNGVWRSMS